MSEYGRQRKAVAVTIIALLSGLLLLCLFASGASASETVLFSDGFESAFAGWTKGGKPSWYSGNPRIGTHSIQLPKNSSIQRTVATAGWQDLTVSFWLGASLRKSGAALQALWFDGSAWTLLTEIHRGDAEADGQLHYFEFALPSSAGNNSTFALRFRLNSRDPKDYGYVDDVAVAAASSYMCTLAVEGTDGSVKVNGVAEALPWSGFFEYGASVVLEAIPDVGYHFVGWSGALTGSANPATIVMSADKDVTAEFAVDTYALAVGSGTGHGSIIVDGFAHSLPWSGVLERGASVELEAVPDSGYHFTGWAGDLTGTTNPTLVTMDSDQSVSVGFAASTYVLSLSGSGGGVNVNGVYHSLPDTVSAAYGSTLTLQSAPATGYHFTGWSGDLTGSTDPTPLFMESDKSVTVGYARSQYALNLSGTGNGAVMVNGTEHALPWSGVFEYGDTVVLEAVPAAGSHFISWSGDLTDPANPTWIVMDSAKTMVAGFGLNTHTLTVNGTNGTVEVNGALKALPWSGPFSSGEVVDLEAAPVEGHHFVAWSGDLSGPTNPTTITMNGDHVVTAEFAANSFTLAVSGIHGSLNVDGVAEAIPYTAPVDYGQVVNLEAVPDSGYRFTGWSGAITGTTNPVDVSITGNTAITAAFGAGGYTLSLSGIGGNVKIDGIEQILPWSGQYDYGTSVTLEPLPDSCTRFGGWSGDLVGVENPATVTLDADKTIAATFDPIEVFNDVACDFWAAREIAACFYEGIVAGYPDGGYHPEITVARDQMAVYISRALAGGDSSVPAPVGDPTFTDVAADHWAYKYIEYAVANHIVQGYPEGDYRPANPVTRDQMAVYIARAMVDPTGEDGLSSYTPPSTASFPDVPAGFWSYKHIEYCVAQGVVKGYTDGRYHPEGAVTRDQMAVYIARAFELPM